MSITIAGIEFARHHYDDRGDVLYLNTERHDGTAPPAHAYATPEGHGIEYDEEQHVTALTLVNVRFLIGRDVELKLTWPDGHVTHDAPAEVLPAAA